MTMRMSEALEWAAEYADRTVFQVQLKSNGYPPDGYQPPTAQEKVAIIKDLALLAYQAEVAEDSGAMQASVDNDVWEARCNMIWAALNEWESGCGTTGADNELKKKMRLWEQRGMKPS